MSKHTILFLAANPLGTGRLALDQEARAIQVELERSGHRDQFELVTRWAAEPLDLLRELRKLKPTIVHFSGYRGRVRPYKPRAETGTARDTMNATAAVGGDDQAALVFYGADGRPQFVSTATLAEMFSATGSSVKLAVFSACYSEVQADALLAHVGCVVGMRGSVSDDAAKNFAIGFYGGIGEGESVAAAFRQGVAATRLEGTPNGHEPHVAQSETAQCDSTIRLLTPPGSDPDSIYIVGGHNQRRYCSIVIRADLKEFDVEVIARVRDELRTITGDVMLEIVEIKEGSVRLTLSLSLRAAIRMRALRKGQNLTRICGFDIASTSLDKTTDFSEVDLRGTELRGVDLSAADLRGADLSGADLSGADLRGADLSGADLSGADLSGADLSGARLCEVDVVDVVDFIAASIAERGFPPTLREIGEHFNIRSTAVTQVGTGRGIGVLRVNLNRADLRGAKLSGVDLSGVDLSGIKHDATTMWPDGFDPTSIGTDGSVDVADAWIE